MSSKKQTPAKKTKEASAGRGRPVNKNSARQKRLTRFEEIKAAGGVVKRGRPSNPNKVAKVKKVKVAKEKKAKTTPVEQEIMDNVAELENSVLINDEM